ncbi:hypothetical protein GDO78_020483 [Eleutherodactylus coqui]|uniref:Uncharacterized protein n=1 Tax=Eleutherodactylus coqui TaxID=57060 RepID=A0A8J6EHP3_ELECQ|nr:hypothetical protein GDO78_020483 [Eleutherodactylus coqui]
MISGGPVHGLSPTCPGCSSSVYNRVQYDLRRVQCGVCHRRVLGAPHQIRIQKVEEQHLIAGPPVWILQVK